MWCSQQPRLQLLDLKLLVKLALLVLILAQDGGMERLAFLSTCAILLYMRQVRTHPTRVSHSRDDRAPASLSHRSVRAVARCVWPGRARLPRDSTLCPASAAFESLTLFLCSQVHRNSYNIRFTRVSLSGAGRGPRVAADREGTAPRRDRRRVAGCADVACL